MLWPSTVIGAGAGFALASIPGALLGALLGQAMDRRLQLHSWAHLREKLGGRPVLRDDEVLFVLLGRLAKSGGRVLEGHIQQARHEMQRLEMDTAGRKKAIDAFNRGKAGREKVDGHLRRLKEQPHAAEGVLRACCRMAWAEGRAGREQKELLVSWGQQLGWSAAKVQALAGDYEPRKVALEGPGSYPEALRLLGVTAEAEPGQIKQAYRRLLSRHHPDKLQGSGASPARVREATERTRELHQAYSIIRKRHGF